MLSPVSVYYKGNDMQKAEHANRQIVRSAFSYFFAIWNGAGRQHRRRHGHARRHGHKAGNPTEAAGRVRTPPRRDASAVCRDGTGRTRRTAAQQRARTRTTSRAQSRKPGRGGGAGAYPNRDASAVCPDGTGRARRTATRQHRQRAAAQTTNSGAIFSHPSRPSPVPPSLSHPSRPRPLSQPSPVLPASPLNLFFCS